MRDDRRMPGVDGAVAAIDLGASSGRVIVGRVSHARLVLEEVHRFPNEPVQLEDGLYWDVLRLHHEVIAGLRHASRSAPDLRSVGIDTWGADVGFLDAARSLVGNPVHHRDLRNLPAMERVHALIDPAALYARNGLQVMPFNTLYQLEAARRTPAFGIVRHVLPLPDLLGYWLTGVVIAERTHASTTGLLDPRTRSWDEGLVRLLGLNATLLPPLADPGTVRGGVLPAVREATGLRETTVVTLVGSHDTASAVVAVPADRPAFAYISSGTWSLVGVETRAPILHRGEPGGELHKRGRGRRDDSVPSQRHRAVAAPGIAACLGARGRAGAARGAARRRCGAATGRADLRPRRRRPS